VPRLKNRKGNRITADLISSETRQASQPSPSRFPAVDMPHRIFTLSSAPMPFNRAEDPPDHCMVCTYVYVSHCCNTPAHTTNTALSSSVSSPLRSSFIIPTGVRTKTASFHWVHVANSSTITKGDPIPYHPHGSFLCVLLPKQASHTHTTHPPSQEGTQESYSPSKLPTHHATRYILL
jgi:hypothetical protein